jgi:hypothetical protein
MIDIRPASRLLVLDRVGGEAIATYEDTDQRIVRGSVTFERKRTVRRRGSVTLSNVAADLTPHVPGDLLYTGALVRLERGERGTDGTPAYEPLATLVVASFVAGMDGSLELSGEGVTSLLAQPFGDAVVITEGTSPEAALRELWAPVLDPTDDGAAWDLDGGGKRMPLRSFLPDEDRLDSVVRYFAASGLDVYEDRLGQPTMVPTVDLTAALSVAVVRDFEPGLESILLSLRRTGGRRAYNRVIVESNAPGGPALRVVLDVSDTSSPLHRSRIGLQTAPTFRSAQMPDLAAAGVIARRLLTEYAFGTDSVSGSAVPDISLDAGDVVTIEEPRSGTTGRYRLDSLTLPVVEGSMSLTAGRVVPLLVEAES